MRHAILLDLSRLTGNRGSVLSALKAVIANSDDDFVDLVAEEGVMGVMFDWLKNLGSNDEVVTMVCGLLADVCKKREDALAFFMEQDGFDLCIGCVRAAPLPPQPSQMAAR